MDGYPEGVERLMRKLFGSLRESDRRRYAAIEAAKLREHRSGDPAGAMAAVERGLHLAARRRARGMPEPALEADLRHRWRRLRDRLARAAA